MRTIQEHVELTHFFQNFKNCGNNPARVRGVAFRSDVSGPLSAQDSKAWSEYVAVQIRVRVVWCLSSAWRPKATSQRLQSVKANCRRHGRSRQGRPKSV